VVTPCLGVLVGCNTTTRAALASATRKSIRRSRDDSGQRGWIRHAFGEANGPSREGLRANTIRFLALGRSNNANHSGIEPCGLLLSQPNRSQFDVGQRDVKEPTIC
jgi:hypothetical protein